MFVAIEHDIHDARRFSERAEGAMPPPQGLHVHFFLPSRDGRRAICLYEADAIEPVREFVDGVLGDSSTQRYVPVAEEAAFGLPVKQVA